MIDIDAKLVKELRERTGVGIMECKYALLEANGNIDIAIDNIRKSGKTNAANKAYRNTAEGLIITKISTDNKLAGMIEINCETDFVAKEKSFKEFSENIINTMLNNNICDINYLKEKFEDQRSQLVYKTGENINIRRAIILNGQKLTIYNHINRIGVIIVTKHDEKKDTVMKSIAMHIAASKPKYLSKYDIPSYIISHEYDIQLSIAMKLGKSNEITEKIISGRMNKFKDEICLLSQPFIMDTTQTIGKLIKDNEIQITNFLRYELGEKFNFVK